MTDQALVVEAAAGASPNVGRELIPLTSTKLQSWHRKRQVIVYVRQSSPQQVLENRESTARQYALVDRAVALGWPRDRIEVIDEDQGVSGRSIAGRLGFQRLLAEVGLDHVGLVLGLEMRQAGLTLKQVAKHLNQAGVSSLRGRPFTNYMVSRLLVQRGLYLPYSRKRPESVVLNEHEWWLPALAEMLEMPRTSLTNWYQNGWVRGRKLPGLRGRLILWADAAEIDRLKQLRRAHRGWSDAPYPTKLTTPT